LIRIPKNKPPQDKRVFASALSKDGRYLATISTDGGLEIRDMNSVNGSEVVSKLLPGSGNHFTNIALSPDGRYLASVSQDGTAALWRWRPEDQLAVVRRQIGRDFTPTEIHEYQIDLQYRKGGK
jgi:WD40 repeat protein